MSFTRWVNTNGLSIYLFVVACLLLGPWTESGMLTFSLDRGSVKEGELWRLWSGQLVHSSWRHLALNIAGLIILQQLFGEQLKWRNWLIAFAFISPIAGTFWVMAPSISWLPSDNFAFVLGMSALLHGLYVYAGCLALHRDKVLAVAVLFGIGAKVIWEQLDGPSEFTTHFIELPIAIDTHLYGCVGGLLLGVAAILTRSARRFALDARRGC